MNAEEQPLYWVGTSKKDLRSQPHDVVQQVGYALHQVQFGIHPNNATPFQEGGDGVYEIKVNCDTNTYRTMYVAKLRKGVYVLHSFNKKSKKGKETPPNEVAKIKARYKEALEEDRKG